MGIDRISATRAAALATASARSRPPQRRDSRRPSSGTGTAHAAAAARRQARERLPRYWFADRLLLTLSGQKPVHWM
ncbi:hypothetical protein QMK28_25855, partial [Streptomyces sp. H27-D2]|nr:hypothetical protein [Streptomyces sp. H27-D2]